MSEFVNFFFFALVVATFSFNVTNSEQDYIDDYFDVVVSKFNDKLESYGVANLKINNTVIPVNRTVSGVHLDGSLSFSNAVVLDVASLTAMKEGHRGSPTDDGVYLFYQVNFPNLTIFSDLEASLQPLGSQKGTAELLFLNTSIAVYIAKNYTEGTTTVDVKPYATMAPQTNFLPVSDVMDAAGKIGRLELGSALLWNQLVDWCRSPFLELVSNAVDEVEFPMIPPLEE